MLSLDVSPVDINSFRVSWRLDGARYIGDVQVALLRSLSFTGPFDVLVPAVNDVASYVDTQLAPGDIPFYRLRIAYPNGPTVDYPRVGGATVAPEVDSELRAVLQEVVTTIRYAGGRRVLYYPARTSGPRCHCFDEVQHRWNSTCRSCFGRGFQGGFFDPIVLHAVISPVSTKYSERFRGQGGVAPAMVPFLPIIRENDVIIERENKRWVVLSADPVEYKRIPMRHTLYLHPVMLDHILQELPVDLSLLGTDSSIVGAS